MIFRKIYLPKPFSILLLKGFLTVAYHSTKSRVIVISCLRILEVSCSLRDCIDYEIRFSLHGKFTIFLWGKNPRERHPNMRRNMPCLSW